MSSARRTGLGTSSKAAAAKFSRVGRMVGPGLFWRSKFSVTLLLAGVTTALLTSTFIQYVAEISIDASRPPRFLSMLELLPFVFAVACLLSVMPRFPEWERLGGRCYRRHVLLAAAVCLMAPQLVFLVGLAALPAGTRGAEWHWIPVNLLTYCALGLLLAAILGHILGAAVLSALFVLVLVVQSRFGPVVAWLPMASGWDPEPRWMAAGVLTALALIAYPRRMGSAVVDSWRRRNAD